MKAPLRGRTCVAVTAPTAASAGLVNRCRGGSRSAATVEWAR